jgi:hypothetical protein
VIGNGVRPHDSPAVRLSKEIAARSTPSPPGARSIGATTAAAAAAAAKEIPRDLVLSASSAPDRAGRHRRADPVVAADVPWWDLLRGPIDETTTRPSTADGRREATTARGGSFS